MLKEDSNRTVELGSDRFHAIILNYANPDMVGHTGVLEASIRAVEAVDQCLKRVTEMARKKGWSVLVTGDHGNCEEMSDGKSGRPHTYHTANPVPFVLVDDDFIGARLAGGESLKSVAPVLSPLQEEAARHRCPFCGKGRLEERRVETIVIGGPYKALLHIEGRQCPACSFTMYDRNTERFIERIRNRLYDGDVIDLRLIGVNFYEVFGPFAKSAESREATS